MPTHTPHLRPPVKTPKPTPILKHQERTGASSLYGLISFFRAETGEIFYLAGVNLYVTTVPLTEDFTSMTMKVSPAEAKAYRSKFQARLNGLASADEVVFQGQTDQFGRFHFTSLPDGQYYLVGIGEAYGHYLVWQKPIRLERGKVTRVYLNRNNLGLLSE